jgi:hypothetical protein
MRIFTFPLVTTSGFTGKPRLFHLRSDAPAYEDSVNEQVQQIIAKKGRGDLGKLLHGAETWEIE